MLAAAAGAPPEAVAPLLAACPPPTRAELARVLGLRPLGDWAFGRTSVDPRTLALFARAVVDGEAAAAGGAAGGSGGSGGGGGSAFTLPAPARPGGGARLDALVCALALHGAAAEAEAARHAALGPATQQLLLGAARDLRRLQAEAAGVAAARGALARERAELAALRAQLGLPAPAGTVPAAGAPAAGGHKIGAAEAPQQQEPSELRLTLRPRSAVAGKRSAPGAPAGSAAPAKRPRRACVCSSGRRSGAGPVSLRRL
jgi:hypothetical protein